MQLDQRRRVHLNYPDYSGVILDESQSGKTMDVQRGFEIDRNKMDQKEDEINSGDSSNIQKSRHSSSSSSSFSSSSFSDTESRRIQLNPTGEKPEVLTTTYTHNSSGTSSIGSGDLSSNRGGVFYTESSGSTSLGGGFRGSEEGSFESRLTNLEQPYGIRTNQSDRVENREELERRRQEEERHKVEWRKEEEERRRQQEEKRLQEEREHRYNYDEERRYDVTTGGYHRTTEDDFITGDREETVESQEFGLHNVNSKQEAKQIFDMLPRDVFGDIMFSDRLNLINRRPGQLLRLSFNARFRTSPDKKDYIEFRDGSMIPLQDRYGEQSYVSESTERRDSEFFKMKGRPLIAPDGKGYVMLEDGRRFPLHGFTHPEQRTYTWHEESSSRAATSDGGYESRYDTRTHEERRTEERTSNTRVYGRNTDRFNDEIFTDRPDHNVPSSRYRRESDMVDVEEFKKFERLHRHRRDLELDKRDFPSDATAFQDDDYYENDFESKIQLCDAAKCVRLQCNLGSLKKDQEVWISARYRVDAKTLKKVALEEKVKVSTKLEAHVTKQPYIGTPTEPIIRSYEVMTNIEPSAAPSTPDMIPIWVVVLSACAGMIILLLLIYLLYKVSPKTNVMRMMKNYN